MTEQRRPGRRSNDDMAQDIIDLRKELEVTNKNFIALTTQVEGLLEAWRTANGLVKFIKWLAALSTAVSVIWLAITGNWHK